MGKICLPALLVVLGALAGCAGPHANDAKVVHFVCNDGTVLLPVQYSQTGFLHARFLDDGKRQAEINATHEPAALHTPDGRPMAICPIS